VFVPPFNYYRGWDFFTFEIPSIYAKKNPKPHGLYAKSHRFHHSIYTRRRIGGTGRSTKVKASGITTGEAIYDVPLMARK